jgi:hypothetical protein
VAATAVQQIHQKQQEQLKFFLIASFLQRENIYTSIIA